MPTFTPLSALAGGILIGLAAVLLLALNGRVAGVSGIAAGLLESIPGNRLWRWLFLAGLMLGAAAWVVAGGARPSPRPDFPPAALVLGGLLVGYGTALGSGCTSGHGVCGLARGSLRSLCATLVFVGTALATTFVARHLLGLA